MRAGLSIVQFVGPDQAGSLGDVVILTRHFVRRGHRVTVVGPLSRPSQEQFSGLGARWVNFPLPAGGDVSRWLQVARQVRRLLRSSLPDLVHSHGVLVSTATALASWGLPRRPRLVMSLPDLGSVKLSPAMGLVARWAISRARQVTVGTAADLGALKQGYARAAGKARVVHHAVEVRPTRGDFDVGMKRQALGISPHTAVVGLISPAVANLGVETFLHAASVISRDFPNVEFLLVGDGPDQPALQLLAHELGLGGAAVFRGSRTDIPEIIGSLNVLVIPHETPGAMRHALQAVVQEIPVVAVQAGALTEVLEDIYPDALVAPGDVDALVAALARNLELPPPPESRGGVVVDGGIVLSYSDLLASRDSYDFDAAGLTVEKRDESPIHRAAERALRKFGAQAMVQAIENVYTEATSGQGISPSERAAQS